MRESTTYQAILRQGREEGRIAGERHVLVRLGTERFGKPAAGILAAIQAIRDVERLESLAERMLDPNVPDWNSLLGAP